MTRITPLAFALALLLASSAPALAAPVQIDFNVAGFGPTDEAHQTFTKVLGGGLPDLTFDALDSSLAAQGHLHWDAADGNGFADGFGVRDFQSVFAENGAPPAGSTYSQDEIEGDERLRLALSTPTLVHSFNVTDFFFENEGNLSGLPICVPLDPNCYREIGDYSVDNGATWIPFLSDPGQLRGNLSNGVLTIPVNQILTSIILRAPGAIDVGGFSYRQLHDYSLAGVKLERGDVPPEVPEPTTLVLLGTGIAGLGLRRYRRRS